MKTKRGEKHVFRSMVEFEKTFFPKSFERRTIAEPKDARALGISLASESIKRIRERIVK